MEAIEVGAGEYEDYRTLATFAERTDAEAYVAWYNATHIDQVRSLGPAKIGGTISHYAPGEWRPTSQPLTP